MDLRFRYSVFPLVFAVLLMGGCRSKPASETAPVAAPQGEAPAARVLARQHIYEENTDANADIAAALKKAKAEHKRVLIDFGGDWCTDCQVLDIYFHQPENAALLDKYYVLAHVFIPEKQDKNREIGEKYGVVLAKGVPALAVVDGNGKVIYGQAMGVFENMRHMESASVTDFLNKWKG